MKGGGAGVKGAGTRAAKKREAEAGAKVTSAMTAVSRHRMRAGAKGSGTMVAKKHKRSGDPSEPASC